MKIDQRVLDWLLKPDQPAVRYRTLIDLLDRRADDSEVKQAYNNIAKRGWARDILAKQEPGGYWESRRSLYRPKYTATNWMSIVLSDFGLTRKDKRIRKAADLFFKDWLSTETEDNIFKDEVCIVGNAARMLTHFGYDKDSRVRRLYDRLVEDQKQDGGWHCFESTKGTLDCWEALAAYAALPNSNRTRKIKQSIERGAEFYLERRLFKEGSTKYLPWFRFHYPIHYYYDVLVGLDAITSLGYGSDKRLEPALEILKKRKKNGVWLLDRAHPDPASYAWGKGNLKRKNRAFALEQVGKPSKWITLTALRVLKRVQES